MYTLSFPGEALNWSGSRRQEAPARWVEASTSLGGRSRCSSTGAGHSNGRTQFKGADGRIVNGVQHVDTLIANGFSEIRSYPRGASKIYMLVHPERSEGYTVKAKDGTLDYARTLLKVAA